MTAILYLLLEVTSPYNVLLEQLAQTINWVEHSMIQLAYFQQAVFNVSKSYWLLSCWSALTVFRTQQPGYLNP